MRLWGKVMLFVVFAAAFVSAGRADGADAAGCKDSPLFTRMPNFSIDSCDKKDFDKHEFVDAGENEISVEGKATRLSYVMNEGAQPPSELQILKNHDNAAQKSGGTVQYEDGGNTYLKITKDGAETWVHVRAFNQGEAYDLAIIEKKRMVQDVTAGTMLDELNKKGFVTLYINFDIDKATIKPESQPTINQIAKLLKDNPVLNVSIEGHTDNTGTPEHNKSLSQQRAQSVVAELTKSGIDGKRLAAAGWGQQKPIADNITEQGRAKNRRVEIVKK